MKKIILLSLFSSPLVFAQGFTDKQIKFATGLKTEVYCQDIGLVEAKGEHADGAKDRLVLLPGSERKLVKSTYNSVIGGFWKYDYEGTNQPLATSKINAKKKIRRVVYNEQRLGEGNENEKGTWTVYLNQDKSSLNTSGNPKAPIPYWLANDLHNWGSPHLGQDLKFELGYKDQVGSSESNYEHERIELLSDREVTQELPNYEVTDFQGNKINYTNCFEVKYTISVATP